MSKIKRIHVNDITTLATKKLSANAENTAYTVGLDGEVVNGTPDVLFQWIVFIKSTMQIWTHGVLYCVTDYNDLRNKPLVAVGNGFLSGKINQIIESMKEENPETAELIESYYRPYVNGNNAFALGLGSHAEGYNSYALGIKSIARGDSCVAVGYNSRIECTITRDYDYDNQSKVLYVRYADFAIHGGSTFNYLVEGNGVYVEQAVRVEQEEGEEEQEEEIVLTLSDCLNEEYKKGDKIVFGNGSYDGKSYTEGIDCLALALGHAAGDNTRAWGEGSYTVGKGTEAKNAYEFACGKFNKSSDLYTCFSVGVGTYQERKNALEVTEDGKVYVKGLGGYNGTNCSSNSTKELQQVIVDLQNEIANLKTLISQNELIVASAINDLDSQKAEGLIVASAIADLAEKKADELTVASALVHLGETKAEKSDLEEAELVSSSAIADLAEKKADELVVASAIVDLEEKKADELATASAIADIESKITTS